MIQVEKTVTISMGLKVAEELAMMLNNYLQTLDKWSVYTVGLVDIHTDLARVLEEENETTETLA